MNLSEFKAWFEGFTESMDGPPGEKAWKRIQDRVKSIKNDEPTTRHVFHEYCQRPWQRWYGKVDGINYLLCSNSVAMQNGYAGAQGATGAVQQATQHTSMLSVSNTAVQARNQVSDFDPREAFNKLGRAEALSLT